MSAGEAEMLNELDGDDVSYSSDTKPQKNNLIRFLSHKKAWHRFHFLILFLALLFQLQQSFVLALRIEDVLLQRRTTPTRLGPFGVCFSVSRHRVSHLCFLLQKLVFTRFLL